MPVKKQPPCMQVFEPESMPARRAERHSLRNPSDSEDMQAGGGQEHEDAPARRRLLCDDDSQSDKTPGSATPPDTVVDRLRQRMLRNKGAALGGVSRERGARQRQGGERRGVSSHCCPATADLR